MKVCELIEKLKQCKPESEVYFYAESSGSFTVRQVDGDKDSQEVTLESFR